MSQATIMIVEDDSGTRRTLGGILEDAGYQVIEAERVSDALKTMQRNPCDLVITDIRLPDASGMEIIKQAKAVQPTAVVMIVTGYASVETAVEAVKQGAYAYFTKPINPAELMIDIANALKQQRLILENKRLLSEFQHANKQLLKANKKLRSEVAERKRVEEALRESEGKLNSMFKSTPDFITVMDKELNILWANEQFKRAFGDETIGKKCYQVYHGRKEPCKPYPCPTLKAFKDGKVHEREFQVTDQAGNPVYLHCIANVALSDKGGKPTAVMETLRNITERKKITEELAESEARYRSLVNNVQLGILRSTPGPPGRILEVNPALEEITGYARDELLAMDMEKLYAHVAERRALMKELATVKGSVARQLRWRKKDGSEIVVLDKVITLRDEAGNVLHFDAIIEDITERKQIAEALRENEEKYRTLVETSIDMIFMLDPHGKFMFANKEWERRTGYAIKDILGKDGFTLIHPDDISNARQSFSEVLKGHTAENLELRSKTKSGSYLDILMSAAPLTDSSGNVTAIIGTAMDITERKQAEEKHQAIIKTAVDGFWIADLAGRFLEVNDSYCEMVGYTQEELLKMSIPDIEAVETNQDVAQRIKKIAERGYDRFETRHKRKDGRIIDVEVSVNYLDAGEGQMYVFVRDITERKQAEEELKESREKLQRMFESVTDGINVSDLNGIITETNQKAVEMYGANSTAEIIGKNALEFIAPRDRSRAMANLEKTLKEGEIKNLEYTLLRIDGTEYPGELSASVLRDGYGNPVGFIAITRDITERKRAEEERRSIEQKAYIASRLASIGELASGIAHEINNPLTAILGYSQSLLRKDVPEDTRRKLEIIRDGTERVADIVGRLLAFSRQRKPERSYVNINEVVESTLALQAYELQTANIKVTTKLTTELPYTMADAGQMQEVFLNIIINAETEMKLAHGGGQLLIKSEVADDTIRVSFKDDGPGIAKGNLGRIFEPFFTTRAVGEGTGLGLSLCHGIVLGHKGRIYAKSRLGEGATFIVELPVVAKEAPIGSPESGDKAKKVTRARILVVDDELAIRQLLSEELTDEGHYVDTAESAGEALYKLQNNNYDLILLDVKLRGMSGIKLYQFMGKMPRHLAKRVVFITGDVIGTDTRKFFLETKATYISKPFNVAQLRKDVNRMLSRLKG
jgi:PAS domain S-box-containing protein